MRNKQNKRFSRADIERYYSGNLSAKEMHDMEAYALEDPFFSDALDGYKDTHKVISDENLDAAKKFIEEYEQKNTIPLSARKNNRNKYAVAASILLLVAVGALYLFNSNKQEERIATQTNASTYIDTTQALEDLAINNFTDSMLQSKEDAVAIQQPKVIVTENEANGVFDADTRLSRSATPATSLFEKTDTIKKSLNDVAVVGYGTQYRAAIAGAVSENNSDVANTLQGTVAAVEVSKTKNVKVESTIRDDLSNPVDGVSVMIKNSNRGALTNSKGRFSLSANSQDTLVVSRVGYESKEIAASQITENITLQPEKYAMEEMVVVGYDTKRKKNATVLNKREAFSRAPVSTRSGIKIRGMNSSAKDSPLIVIDGMIASQEKFDKLNKADIESVNILKDKNATAIYGSKATNGVILITTKKAKKDSLRIKDNMREDISK